MTFLDTLVPPTPVIPRVSTTNLVIDRENILSRLQVLQKTTESFPKKYSQRLGKENFCPSM